MGLYCCKWLLLLVVCMAVRCQADDILDDSLTVNNTSNDVLNASVLPGDPLVNEDTSSKCREDLGQGGDRDNCSGVNTQRILSFPVGCPVGYAADAQGLCRELWNSNSACGPTTSLLLELTLLPCYLTVAWARSWLVS